MKMLKNYVTEYLSSRVIFVLDLCISFVSSLIILLILNFFASSDSYSGTFALWWLGSSLAISALVMVVLKTYNVIIRHMTLGDISKYVFGILISQILLGFFMALTSIFNETVLLALFANFLLTVVLVIGMRFVMVEFYEYYKSKVSNVNSRQRILVYGTSDKAVAAITRFSKSRHYQMLGYISTSESEKNLTLAGYPVLSCRSEEDFKAIIANYTLYAVLFATDTDVRAEEAGIVSYCTNNGIKTLIVPSIEEVLNGRVMKGGIRQVKIEDLLGRPEIKISMDAIRKNFQGKVVMVTGAAGSIGAELCRQLAGFGVKKLVLFDNAETPMHNLRLELEARFPRLDFVPLIGSVCHENRLDYAFRSWHPQVVFHAAAYKHVPLMEENPCEAVSVNVNGSRLVADKCVQYDVEKMVMISTDKAVNPTNIMGCSKRLAEIYVQSLGLALASGEVKGRTQFVTTRFGNVLGSNGSVIPRFREQIENGGPVTVTHPEITRFFMTIPEACRLVMEAATIGSGNQIFAFDMGESVKIVDLATRMIELAGLNVGEDIQIEYTGLRPGEKLYEEVLANSENTEPTSHDRIRIAKVREYPYQDALRTVDELTQLAAAVNIPEMVKLMKRTVPEFKSKNSSFEQFD